MAMQWEPPARAEDLVLAMHGDVLELRGAADRPGTGVRVDLGTVDPRGMRSTPLVRAMGERVRTVADATAGLLADAWLLAMAGFEVTAFERSPAIAALARDGIRRAADDPRIDRTALARLRLVEADAITALGHASFDAVLVDPMFPPRRRASALPRKEIQVLRVAVGDDPDAEALLSAARAAARMRTAVKRGDDAPALSGPPDLTFGGSTTRMDVYLSGTPR